MAKTITVPTMKMYPKASILNLLGEDNRCHKTADGEDCPSDEGRNSNRFIADKKTDNKCGKSIFPEFAEDRDDGFSFLFIKHAGNITYPCGDFKYFRTGLTITK